MRESTELPVHAQVIRRHPQGHLGGVRTLQFDVNQFAIIALTQQVHPGAAHLGQFDIQPAADCDSHQLTESPFGGLLQQEL